MNNYDNLIKQLTITTRMIKDLETSIDNWLKIIVGEHYHFSVHIMIASPTEQYITIAQNGSFNDGGDEITSMCIHLLYGKITTVLRPGRYAHISSWIVMAIKEWALANGLQQSKWQRLAPLKATLE